MGATSVSWAPSIIPGSLTRPNNNNNNAPGAGGPAATEKQKRFVTGGCDSKVKIWAFREATDDSPEGWFVEETIDKHTDWVRDVSWAPNIGLPTSYIASCSQDKTVLIHTRASPSTPWTTTPLLPGEGETFPEVVWRVSWSLAGNVLAVSGGDGKVTLWKEKGGGAGWECVSEMSS